MRPCRSVPDGLPLCIRRLAASVLFVLVGGACSTMAAPNGLQAGTPEVRPSEHSTVLSAEVLGILRRFDKGVAAVPASVTPAAIVGRYSRQTPQLASLIGGGFLGGENLYLFWDGRYVYTEWADVEPETIYETGLWYRDGSLVVLKADDSGKPSRPPRDAHFVLFRLSKPAGDVRLVGAALQVKALEQSSGDEHLLALLSNSLGRLEDFKTSTESQKRFRHLTKHARKLENVER